MLNIFKHKHDWKNVDFIYHPSKKNPLSACPCTAKVYQCKCGAERRELTDAGHQQIGWGDDKNELLGLKV